ncbi:MAG: rhomboid family intramembrane serine protease [Chitinophagales bacterium]|nr:rhomboid family intramembrane serine protease [Chitinophagales bacterium]
MENSLEQSPEKRKLSISIFIPLMFVVLLWLVFIIQWSTRADFYKYGILPRHVSGLAGIVFTPFIHGSWDHLFSNSIPLLILGSVMIYFYRDIAYKVFLWIWLADGLGVWLFAREEYHIGASGLVYGMVGFVFFSGILRRNRKLLALSLVIIFLYGSIIWGILPFLIDISWEAHLFGLLAGIFFSVYYLHRGPSDDPVPEWMEEVDEDHDQEHPPDTIQMNTDFLPEKEEKDNEL